ncbi:MAG: DUF1552 domain-containing protein [Myxococcaceae bacterium]|nr:DUF1552 domain-containing protein [Myxococcaceae bacterium]
MISVKDLVGPDMTRRKLFALSGKVALASFLQSVLFERAEAQSAIPRRVIFLHSHNGVQPSAWNMTSSGGMVQLGASFSALNVHRAHINVVEGMRYVHSGPITGHVAGAPSFLTNQRIDPYDQNTESARAVGQSLDYYLARQLAAQLGLGIDLRGLLLSMSMGDQWGGGEYITYEGSKLPVKAITDPARAFDKAFATAPPIMGTPRSDAGTPGPVDAGVSDYALRLRAYREKKSVADFVKKDFESVRSKLSKAERTKVDEHFQAVSDIEKGLQPPEMMPVQPPPAMPPPGMTTPFEPGPCASSRTVYSNESGNFRRFARIALEAMACGQTQVSVIRLVGGNGIGNGAHHEWHHGEGTGDPTAQHNAVTAWQAGEVAWLLGELLARRESGVPMLDNTLVVWSNEIGIGGYQEHGGTRLPLILAGRCGGYFATGRLVTTTNRSHSQLLVSAAKAMGLGSTMTGFGNMTGCETGELAEIKA